MLRTAGAAREDRADLGADDVRARRKRSSTIAITLGRVSEVRGRGAPRSKLRVDSACEGFGPLNPAPAQRFNLE